jgi:cytochrome b561
MSLLTIFAHWISAFVIVCALSAIWLRELMTDEAIRAMILNTHRQIGLTVLVLWFVRLTARIIHPKKHSGEPLTPILKLAAAGSHVALYSILLAMPILGWATTNAQGHAVLLFNLLPLPTLTAVDPDMVDTLQEYHKWGSWALMGIVVMHFSAALWHHIFRKDHVLAAMIPLVKPRVNPKFESTNPV